MAPYRVHFTMGGLAEALRKVVGREPTVEECVGFMDFVDLRWDGFPDREATLFKHDVIDHKVIPLKSLGGSS